MSAPHQWIVELKPPQLQGAHYAELLEFILPNIDFVGCYFVAGLQFVYLVKKPDDAAVDK